MPNDTFLKNDDSQWLLIIGQNIVGKLKYIRIVALITLFTHLAGRIPQKNIGLLLVDKIFSRICSGDNFFPKRSTIMMEMCKNANILNNANDASLIILDVVGSGKNTYDGLSIAWSVIEFFHKNSKF